MNFNDYFFQVERKLMVVAIIASMISGLAGAVLIGMIGQHLGGNKPPTTELITLYLGLIVFVISSNLVAKWMLFRLTAQYSYMMHKDLVRRILATPFKQLEHIGSPRLLSILTEDIKIISLALNQMPRFFVNISIVTGCLLYLLWLSPVALFILSFVAIPVYFIYRHLHKKARRLLHRFFELRDTRFEHYEALTMGLKELLINARRRHYFIHAHFEKNLKIMRSNLVSFRMAHEMANSWSQSAYFFFILILFLLTMFDTVDAGIIGGYALVTLYMRNSINQLLNVVPQWTQANVALQKIEELKLSPYTPINTEQEHDQQSHMTQPLTVELRDIQYNNVDETGNTTFAFGPLNLQFNTGEIIFIAGKNGSGKTTLLKILTSLYMPNNGQITLNNTTINEQNLAWYQQHFSIIFTDYFLFKEIIDGQHNQQQASEYIQKLELSDKVVIDEGNISTLRLSHGQRKRLALLHAYMEDRPVYVFDEWAENQDPVFRETFYRHLLPELKAKGKLVIAVSHDDRYYNTADRVIYLDGGRVNSPF